MNPRIAVLGAGAWGLNHVRCVASEPGCELIVVCDPDPRVAACVAQIAPAVQVVRDPDHVMSDPSVDAVIIATPSATHAALGRAALGAGKHVLLEKPVALSTREGRGLADLARTHDRIALVGHLMVYHPALGHVRELWRSGELGEVSCVHSTRANLGRFRPDESVLWTFGPHDLSMLDHVLDEMPVSVSASGRALQSGAAEDIVFMTLRYGSGLLAHIHLSRVSPRKERRLTIVGTHQLVELDDMASDKLRICKRGHDGPPTFTEYGEYLSLRDGDVQLPCVPMREPLREQLRHFLSCIRHEASPITDLASGIRVTAVLEAADGSLRQGGRPVDVVTA